MDYIDLGLKIRQLRRQKSMTQEQLAEMAGISPSFLGHIERGTRVASVDTLVASSGQRARLSEFLRLAQDAVRDWDK